MRGLVTVIETDPVVRQSDLELLVERQERFEQVLLVQCEATFDEPLGRVVVWKEDVVHVYPDARRETRQDLEKLVTDVATKLHGVARVDEENVVRLETREEIDVDLFDALLNQLDV